MTPEEQKIYDNKLKLLKKTNDIIYILRGKKDWFGELEVKNPRFMDIMQMGIRMAFNNAIDQMQVEFDKPFKRTIK